MNVEIITNPKLGAMSGIHKSEAYITGFLEKLVSGKIVSADEFKRPNFFIRMLYLFLNIIFPFFIRDNKKEDNVLFICDQQLALVLNFIPIRKKVVVMVYDIFPATRYYRKYFSLFEKIRYQLIVNVLKKADYLITMTNMVKQELVEEFGFNGNKIKLVYLGVDHSLYYPVEDTQELRRKLSISPEDKVILYVGSEEPRKNIEGLIRAFKELKNQLPACKLIKIGRAAWSEARRKILSLISDLELTDDVIFKEDIPEDEMRFFYSLADVFVAIPIYEGGWANPVIEAMACGCPIVASKPALEELVDGYGILVKPHEHNEVANSIYEILTDSIKSTYYKERSIIRSRMFSWEKTTNDIASVIKDCGYN